MLGHARTATLPAVVMIAAVTSACFGASSGANAQSADSPDPCLKISVADVQPLFKGPITKNGCSFRTKSGHGAQISLLLGTSDSMLARDAMTEKYDGKPGVPLSGVGDKAVREPGDVSIYAVKGSLFCGVQAGHAAYSAPDASSFEMRGIDVSDVRAGKIPDAKAQPVAVKLGALCKKFFG